ncbi:MAG: hypothetical protein ABIJ00_06210 [Candidatus Eisenbacteria bacterium]
MRRLIATGLAATLLIPALVWAGGAGNPAVTVGKDNYGVTLEAEEQVKMVDEDLVKSRRFVGKLIWGAMDNLDLYARLGASDLRVAADGPDFETPAQNMTWGGGARCGIWEVSKPEIAAYVDLQMLSFTSDNTVKIERPDGWGDTYTEEYYTRYKYNEIQLSVIANWRHEYFSPYIGFGLTHIFGHVDRRGTSESGEVWKDGNDFREDAVPELILGVNCHLGGTGRVSGEMRLSNESDISFFIGLSEILH